MRPGSSRKVADCPRRGACSVSSRPGGRKEVPCATQLCGPWHPTRPHTVPYSAAWPWEEPACPLQRTHAAQRPLNCPGRGLAHRDCSWRLSLHQIVRGVMGRGACSFPSITGTAWPADFHCLHLFWYQPSGRPVGSQHALLQGPPTLALGLSLACVNMDPLRGQEGPGSAIHPKALFD